MKSAEIDFSNLWRIFLKNYFAERNMSMFLDQNQLKNAILGVTGCFFFNILKFDFILAHFGFLARTMPPLANLYML